ncbi:serine hydrolase [Mycobacterium sp. ACS1612]|uniref:serine hydrolase domain-containing protein n=1 Tax=Mycobacterium sp. ACS1612 TaxID=1834117 RepID=UPI0007FF1579|nr:serine hydrolase domain-containing protein [Mycobacterium sp. ACS1612]OBF33555.1 serine hydrolase [Mycobacterium sp. ACS1612]
MTARLFALAIVAALLLTTCSCGQSPPQQPTGSSPARLKPIADALAKRLDAAVDQAMVAAAVPGAIVGIWGPDGDYVRAFGVADKVTKAPMKADFYSRIGSVTKTFTVTALLQLADQGRLNLDDSIAEFVDGVPLGDRITLRQLARMQSGLFNYSGSPEFQQAIFADPHRAFTPRELLSYAFAQPNQFPAGQKFEYSNTNTVLLGLAVQKVSKEPLADYIRNHILTPLGLNHTSFPAGNDLPDPHAQGYTEGADGKEAVATDWNPSWAWAAGAMISTLDDMRAWSVALATGKLLTPQMQAQRLQTVGSPGMPPQDGYGLGIFDLGGWIGHNGSLPGYQTVVVYLPEKQTSLVIMTNTDIEYRGGEASTALATAITKELTPDHVYSLGPQLPR